MKIKRYSFGLNLPTILFTFLLVCFTHSLWASDGDSLFKSDAIINMELRADFSAIQAERPLKAEFHDAELIYYSPDGTAVKFSVRLIIRGHFRRDTANCNFPPLEVNFKKSEVKNTVFNNQNDLKLVTPCVNEKDVIDEYLIYKMYNRVTDLSFKVRLVKVLYYDTKSRRKLFEKYSFFLEKKEHVAERNGLVIKDLKITPYDLERESFGKMAVFQYMIGNVDWNIPVNHNFVIMQPRDDSAAAIYAVPYDFDLSLFVNADYAESVLSKRTYKGLCYKPDEFDRIIKFYQNLKPEFESIINNMDLIPANIRERKLKYILSFFDVIENSKLLKREFFDKCETTLDYKINLK